MIYLIISRAHGALQLSIEDLDESGGGTGYRIIGPKFDGTSEELIKLPLDKRDVREIRSYLDKVGAA